MKEEIKVKEEIKERKKMAGEGIMMKREGQNATQIKKNANLLKYQDSQVQTVDMIEEDIKMKTGGSMVMEREEDIKKRREKGDDTRRDKKRGEGIMTTERGNNVMTRAVTGGTRKSQVTGCIKRRRRLRRKEKKEDKREEKERTERKEMEGKRKRNPDQKSASLPPK